MQLQDVEAAGRLAPFSAAFRAGRDCPSGGARTGAGKSTLLTPHGGGCPTAPARFILTAGCLTSGRRGSWRAVRGYLSQHQTPPFAMPVWHYLALHMQQQGDSARLSDIAARLGLDNKLGRPVNQLSGGEWQRVRLAAVILQIDPLSNSAGQLLLLDEPMNSLDVAQQAALDRLLHELSAAGIAVVMSSHDLNHTLRHAGQSWLLCQGEAIACGETAEVLNEENLTAAYAIPFQRVEVAGHIMLIASQ
ncbi:vitamin B12 ABC transporter ATP-binding protein BtuD [Klebsiella pneumoniae]|uniref:vitamin B12 ABC transporter ATP-binding protein BtuD n=1 Tax=Klebsiella pneumoniae TaxID=573 RepID=UPI002542C495|nr:vitamin B12 ABC transporter ATP-binding protein BtuD [Klebsiella pneumoniae]